ncbi:hypothetical protein TSAR_007819 [Trichomalopsis sarcophagae]|uniref:Peptidase M13 N-terminal domain-containing protein n=1 Tax=Trichomalopsis sarcophagae TaxID=543379 RepID=A0A232FJW0_9HYME|nr:hypothetical protein TSAR_007819 [Trichomalopsis sarcophagae]
MRIPIKGRNSILVINAESKPTNEKCHNVCNSSGCRNEAEFLSKTINPAADPCYNFFEFACGNFVKNTDIHEDAAGIAILTMMDKELETKIINLLKKKIAPSDSKTDKD